MTAVFINVQKRHGSSVCTRNGAILEAIRTNCLDWEVQTDKPLVSIRVKQQLRDRLNLSISELNDNPHASYADHESRGVFGGFTVLERHGFWRVEWEGGGNG